MTILAIVVGWVILDFLGLAVWSWLCRKRVRNKPDTSISETIISPSLLDDIGALRKQP